MASRNMIHGWTNGVAPKKVRFAFRPNSTANPAVVRDPFDFVDTIVCNQAGRWTVTMKDAYYRVLAIRLDLGMVSATDLTLQSSTLTNEGTSTPLTFIVRALAGATETDIASNAQNWVYVELDVEDSDGSGLT